MAIIKHPNSFYELSDYIEHVEKVGNKAEERTYLRLKLKYIYGVNPDNLSSLIKYYCKIYRRVRILELCHRENINIQANRQKETLYKKIKDIEYKFKQYNLLEE